jgi:hypothetical protein
MHDLPPRGGRHTELLLLSSVFSEAYKDGSDIEVCLFHLFHCHTPFRLPCRKPGQPGDPDGTKAILNCSDTLYTQQIAGYLNNLTAPAMYTPGDNEWTDCDRSNDFGGSINALNRLSLIRQLFFKDSFSGGQKKLKQDVQVSQQPCNQQTNLVFRVHYPFRSLLVPRVDVLEDCPALHVAFICHSWDAVTVQRFKDSHMLMLVGYLVVVVVCAAECNMLRLGRHQPHRHRRWSV